MGNLYNAERISRVTKNPIVLAEESVRLSRKTDREAIYELKIRGRDRASESHTRYVKTETPKNQRVKTHLVQVTVLTVHVGNLAVDCIMGRTLRADKYEHRYLFRQPSSIYL